MTGVQTCALPICFPVTIGSIYVTCIVNGKEFTEQITHGKIPLSNHFGDLILVASGEESQMNIEYIKN